MKVGIKSITDFFSKKPKALFLVDGLGAASTTFSLFFVLRHYIAYVGMPETVLNFLAVVGLVYCAYSMSCFFLLRDRRTLFLSVLGIGNLFYCFLTAILLYLYSDSLTRIGLTYFLTEILVIAFLVYIELRVAYILGTRANKF